MSVFFGFTRSLFFLSAMASLALAQVGTSTISGRVTDSTGRGLPGIRVVSGPTRFAFTDADGRYVIRSVVDGERVVAVVMPSLVFSPSVQTIVVKGADCSAVNFQAQ